MNKMKWDSIYAWFVHCQDHCKVSIRQRNDPELTKPNRVFCRLTNFIIKHSKALTSDDMDKLSDIVSSAETYAQTNKKLVPIIYNLNLRLKGIPQEVIDL